MNGKKDLWAGKEPGDYSGLVERAGPCRLGVDHSKLPLNTRLSKIENGMVYCEHGVSDFNCDRCAGRPDTYNPICESCGTPKESHTESEALLCISRQLAEVTDRPIYVAGLNREGPP